jgi:hypothetical protein
MPERAGYGFTAPLHSFSTSINGNGLAGFIPDCTLASTDTVQGQRSKKPAGFETDWKSLLPEIPEDAFEEYRHDRKARAEMRAMRARGEKLPSEVFSSMTRCVCGVQFDSWKPDESYDHRGHIYAAKQQGIHW